MRYELRDRDREIVGTATRLYETLAKTAKKNLDALALPTLQVDGALGNIEVLRERLGTTSADVEIQEELRITVKDALLLMSEKVEKEKKDQLKLTIPLTDTEATFEEVMRLVREFSEQLPLV